MQGVLSKKDAVMNDHLRTLLAKTNLSRRQIALLAGVPIRRLDSWLASPDTSYYRAMPEEYLDKLLAQPMVKLLLG